MKIIQILHHSASVFSADFQQVLYYGWHARFGRELAKRVNCEVECIAYDPSVRKEFVYSKNNVIYRAFPASISLAFGYEYSRKLVQYLKKVSSEANDIIFHIHGVPSLLTYDLALKMRHRIVVIQDHGGVIGGGISPLMPVWIFLGKYALRYVDYFFTVSELKRKYLIEHLGVSPKKIRVQTMGVNDIFFTSLPKSKCREILNLPLDANLVLYVGRFDSFKGLPLLIRAISNLKNKYDVELVAVGGYPNDPLYGYVKKKLRFSFETQPHKLMPYFYNASDVFAWYWKDPRWGGPGVSVMEAMACNKPVISNTLAYVTISREELKEKGCYIPSNSNGLEKYIEQALLRSGCDTRDLAKKYFSWSNIINRTISVYRKLLEARRV